MQYTHVPLSANFSLKLSDLAPNLGKLAPSLSDLTPGSSELAPSSGDLACRSVFQALFCSIQQPFFVINNLF